MVRQKIVRFANEVTKPENVVLFVNEHENQLTETELFLLETKWELLVERESKAGNYVSQG